MANPLAKSIMNNISKKKIDKSNEAQREDSIKNINEKEEDILKSILYKNKNKVNINSLKSENSNKKLKEQLTKNDLTQNNSKKTSIKELANKKEIKEESNNINPKDKQNKKIISLKDLAK